MEYIFLKGILVVLLTQHCTTEGLSSSSQSSMLVTHQDGQTLPQESELPPAEVVPVVAPPSLRDVQQAVLEASEQVEGRGAEEVLKELLERVVEAAMGQVEAGSEGKADEVAVQEVVEEDATWTEKEKAEADIEAKVVEQAGGKEPEGEDRGIPGGYTDVEEEQEVAEVDAFEEVAEEEKGNAEDEGETAAGSVEDTITDVETGETDGVEVINESLDTEVSQGVAESEETGEDSTVEETGAEDDAVQVVSSEEKVAAVTEDAEETPAIVDVASEPDAEQAGLEEADPHLAVADVEQVAEVLGTEESLEGETQVESDVSVLPSDNHETETTDTVMQEEEEEEEVVVKYQLVEETGAIEEVETEGADLGEAAGGERESEVKEESVALVDEGDQLAGGEEQVPSETSHGGETEDQEILVISAPEPEASVEPSTEIQAPNPSPALGGEETGENTLGDETSNHDNEIITPTDDVLPHNPDVPQPTLDNTVKDVLTEPPQAEVEEPGQTHELVEDLTTTTETRELGLEAWKIGAISAAVLLVLETTVIVIYILKCRNKNKIAALDPSDVASTVAQNNELHKEEQAIAMSSSTEESANTGPGPGSSQDLRTSIL
ncbi:uncharacterized protein si:dkeyp-118a3.2 [Limanda limanda]|uniref:uncharacterized protein si:dkeyp-118a3.2 n=1 Tax=Limanda limanda TaxID=27771 RepID=UPI0029C8A8D5|nr:uncharacterized protein si:dkeyp-118a3.2 [Limanda limanda]